MTFLAGRIESLREVGDHPPPLTTPRSFSSMSEDSVRLSQREIAAVVTAFRRIRQLQVRIGTLQKASRRPARVAAAQTIAAYRAAIADTAAAMPLKPSVI